MIHFDLFILIEIKRRMNYKIYFSRIDGEVSDELYGLVFAFIRSRRKSSIWSGSQMREMNLDNVIRKDSMDSSYLLVTQDNPILCMKVFKDFVNRMKLTSSENVIIELYDEYDRVIETERIYNGIHDDKVKRIKKSNSCCFSFSYMKKKDEA